MTHPVAVISGAHGGIGSVISTHLRAHGYDTVGLVRKPDVHNTTCTTQFQCDVTDHLAIQYAANYVAERCDALIIAHGHGPVTTASTELDPVTFRDVLLTDVLGAFMLAQAFGKIMLKQGHGSIIFLSSLHARQTYPARAAYAAAKAGVCGMMRSLALEWGPHGICVNAVLPWQTEGARTTAFLKAAAERGEDLREAYLQRAPLRRLVDPVDIAKTVIYLLENNSITGQELIIDAGVSASAWHKEYENAL